MATPFPGRLEVICGPMFAGKTTELVRRLLEARDRGESVIALKPARDTRYRMLELATHAGLTFPAKPVLDAAAILTAAGDAPVVAIDEGHFFGSALVRVCQNLIRRGARVIVAGVERDHLGRPFEPFPALLCEADEVLKLSGRCARCGGPSVHSQRMFDSDEAIVVGGAESYEPRCRACFDPATKRK
jgi:thymidine kinase